MKPISPFDSAPVSAMNFPVSEYVSAFRDAGKMQMAGQQSMMEGINKGISSVTDYLEESRKSQAQANAFKPFFNKATLQNLMGISGDESAAVIEQFKNASTDEKIALGKVLTGTLVEAENQKKRLEFEKDRARAEMIIRTGDIGYTDLGGAQPVAAGGARKEADYDASANAMISGEPIEGALPEGEPGSGVPFIPGQTLSEEATNRNIARANAAAERGRALQQKISNIDKDFQGEINEIYNTQAGTAQGDPYAEHEQMKKAKLAEIKSLQEKGKIWRSAGDKGMAEDFKAEADSIRKNEPDLLKPFGELKEVSSIIENYRSPKIEGYKNKLTDLKTVVDTARKELPNPNGKSNAISIIQKAIAPRLASLASDNALGETEAKRLMDEITSVFGKEFLSKSVEKLKKGEGISGLFGNNVEQYLDNIDKISTGLMLRYNKNLEETVIKPLGSYASGQGINPINLSEFEIKKPEQSGVNQGAGGTKTNTTWRMTNSGIAPGGNTGVAPENKPKVPFSQATGY